MVALTGLLSTSLSLGQAMSLGNSALMEIELPDDEDLTEECFSLIEDLSLIRNEQEVLFDHLSFFQVLSQQKLDPYKQTYYYVKLRYIPIANIGKKHILEFDPKLRPLCLYMVG